jgi:hypothetical protein
MRNLGKKHLVAMWLTVITMCFNPLACTETTTDSKIEDSGTNPGDDSDADTDSDSDTDADTDADTDTNAPCIVGVEVTMTFWANCCYDSWIRCDGALSPPLSIGDDYESFCDLMDLTCEEPEINSWTHYFEWTGESCEFCFTTDDVPTLCTALDKKCDEVQSLRFVASGSPDAGPQPMTDAGCD